MLIASVLAPTFWAEALKCAAYIPKYIATGAHKDSITPHEKLLEKKPYLSFKITFF